MSKSLQGTGFLDEGRLIIPVSLALVSEDWDEYHTVFTEDVDDAVREGLLRANVVPHLPTVLPSSKLGLGHWPPWLRSRQAACGIAGEVQAFLGGLPEPEVRAHQSPYNAVLLCQLYGPLSRLPAEIPPSSGTWCKRPTSPGSRCQSGPRPCTTHDTTASSPRPPAELAASRGKLSGRRCRSSKVH